MSALKSVWFWLVVAVLLVAAVLLWRSGGRSFVQSKLAPRTPAPPKSSAPSTLQSVADITKAASSIFDTLYSSSDDDDDED